MVYVGRTECTDLVMKHCLNAWVELRKARIKDHSYSKEILPRMIGRLDSKMFEETGAKTSKACIDLLDKSLERTKQEIVKSYVMQKAASDVSNNKVF